MKIFFLLLYLFCSSNAYSQEWIKSFKIIRSNWAKSEYLSNMDSEEPKLSALGFLSVKCGIEDFILDKKVWRDLDISQRDRLPATLLPNIVGAIQLAEKDKALDDKEREAVLYQLFKMAKIKVVFIND